MDEQIVDYMQRLASDIQQKALCFAASKPREEQEDKEDEKKEEKAQSLDVLMLRLFLASELQHLATDVSEGEYYVPTKRSRLREDVQFRPSSGSHCLLFIAAYLGEVEVVRLISSTLDIYRHDWVFREGRPVFEPVIGRRMDAVCLVFERDGYDKLSFDYLTLEHAAVLGDQAEMLEFLLVNLDESCKQAHICHRGSKPFSLLHCACLSGSVNATRVLLSHIDGDIAQCVNIRDTSYHLACRAPLLGASPAQALAVLRLLVDKRASLLDEEGDKATWTSLLDRDGHNVLHLAARCDLELVKFVLGASDSPAADMELLSGRGWNAFVYACEGGHWDIVQYLSSVEGAPRPPWGKSRDHPITGDIQHDTRIFILLLDESSDQVLQKIFAWESSLFFRALETNDPDQCIRRVLARIGPRGSNPHNLEDYKLGLCCQVLCQSGKAGQVRALLLALEEIGVDTTGFGNDDLWPVWMTQGDEEMVTVLLEHAECKGSVPDLAAKIETMRDRFAEQVATAFHGADCYVPASVIRTLLLMVRRGLISTEFVEATCTRFIADQVKFFVYASTRKSARSLSRKRDRQTYEAVL